MGKKLATRIVIIIIRLSSNTTVVSKVNRIRLEKISLQWRGGFVPTEELGILVVGYDEASITQLCEAHCEATM